LISARSDSMECRSLRMLSSPRPSPSTGSNFNPSFFSECKGIRSIFRSPGIDMGACPRRPALLSTICGVLRARHSVLHAGMPARLKSRNPDDQSLIWIVSRWSFQTAHRRRSHWRALAQRNAPTAYEISECLRRYFGLQGQPLPQ
jgi:hypothetical protein